MTGHPRRAVDVDSGDRTRADLDVTDRRSEHHGGRTFWSDASRSVASSTRRRDHGRRRRGRRTDRRRASSRSRVVDGRVRSPSVRNATSVRRKPAPVIWRSSTATPSPNPGWLEGALAHLVGRSGHDIGRDGRPERLAAERRATRRTLCRRRPPLAPRFRLVDIPQASRRHRRGTSSTSPRCNLVVRRSSYRRVGGMDPEPLHRRGHRLLPSAASRSAIESASNPTWWSRTRTATWSIS